MNLESIIAQHQIGTMAMRANSAGVTHQQSLMTPAGGGNCLNWIVGHMVNARADAIRMMGAEPPFPQARLGRYTQGAPPLHEPAEALQFEDLIAGFIELEQPLVNAIRAATPAQLAQPFPNSPTGNPNETVGSMLAAFAFHEAYHLGQTGLLRRMAGLDRAIG
jgi:hypothetical protein